MTNLRAIIDLQHPQIAGDFPNPLQIENDRLRAELKRVTELSEELRILRSDGLRICDIERGVKSLKELKRATTKLNRDGSRYELVYTKFIAYLMEKYSIPEDEYEQIDFYEEDFNAKRAKYVNKISSIREKMKTATHLQRFEQLGNELTDFDKLLTDLINDCIQK